MRLEDRFSWGERTHVMGVINVTPDSFSGDGLLVRENWVDAAIEQGLRMVAEGAHILDVGGESTRPGAEPVSPREELRRVVPVIEALAELADVPVSIDTTKARVAAAALQAGAAMVNDVSGLKADPEMAPLVAARGVPVVIARAPGSAQAVPDRDRTAESDAEMIERTLRELRVLLDGATAAGIAEDQIILDPGIGFARTMEENLALIDMLERLRDLGRPLLIGPSRKPFIGEALDLPPDAQVEGSAAAMAVGIVRGADIVRVHDVRSMARVARMIDAITRRAAAQP